MLCVFITHLFVGFSKQNSPQMKYSTWASVCVLVHCRIWHLRRTNWMYSGLNLHCIHIVQCTVWWSQRKKHFFQQCQSYHLSLTHSHVRWCVCSVSLPQLTISFRRTYVNIVLLYCVSLTNMNVIVIIHVRRMCPPLKTETFCWSLPNIR